MADIQETLRTVVSIVQTTEPQSLEAAAWAWVGPNFWRGYAALSAIGAVLLFKTILDTVRATRRVDAITLSRMIWLGGLILGSFVRLNTACEPLSAAFLVTAATFTSILISSNWCGRRGTPWQKVRAIAGEASRRSNPLP